MIIDTHCHYNLEPLFSNKGKDSRSWQKHWQQAQDHGIDQSIVVGTNLETSKRAATLSQTELKLKAAIGIHPIHAGAAKAEDLKQELTTLLDQNKTRVVAIGEIGLDYFRLPQDHTAADLKQKQHQVFQTQLELATAANLPVILHVRDKQTPETFTQGNAYWDVLEMVKTYHHGQTPLILHCVSGPQKYVKQMLTLGAYIGIAGNITYPSANSLRKLIKLAPSEKLLLETDAPFLPPQQHRGKLCQPWMISLTATFIEETFGVSSQQLIQNTYQAFPLLSAEN